MKILGTLLAGLGVGIVGIMAVLRRIPQESLEDLGVGRSIILPMMLVGGALFGIGIFLNRKAASDED